MPRTYKRKPGARPYRDYDYEKLKKALVEVKMKRMSLRKASKHYGIPVMTIHTNVSGVS